LLIQTFYKGLTPPIQKCCGFSRRGKHHE
jgi:hypothetical protein